MSSELETLCQSCGMCCDGTLFKRAFLRPEEIEGARKHGLRVLPDKPGFEQPCPQLKERSCAVYEHRPSVCRSFVCKLLVRHRDEGGPLEDKLMVVRRVRELLALLDGFGMTRSPDGSEVRFEAEGADAMEAMGAFAELMEHLEHDFARASARDPLEGKPGPQ